MSTAALTASTSFETGEGTGAAETPAPAPLPNPAPAAAPTEAYRGFSIASFVIGITSVVAGWTLFAPVVGLVLGAIALRRGTAERTFALWGVWLNAIMLGIFVLLVTVGIIAFGVFGALALPFWGL